MIEVATWQVITFFISLLLSIAGSVGGLIKMALNQFERRQDEKTTAISLQISQQQTDLQQFEHKIAEFIDAQRNELRRLEREVLELKGDLPVNYVRREDYMRNQIILESKLDALYSKIETLQIKGAKYTYQNLSVREDTTDNNQ